MQKAVGDPQRAFICAMSDCIAEHAEQLDFHVLLRCVGTSTAYFLQAVIRERQLMPDDAATFLDQFCRTLQALTMDMVRAKDAAGDEL